MASIRRPIHQYSEEALNNAMQAIFDGSTIRAASKTFGVPRGTLQDRIHGRVKHGPRKMGPQTVLSNEEENDLVKWITDLAKCGFPRKKVDLLDSIQQILKEQQRSNTPFKNNRPGDKWYSLFLKRHPDIVLREPEGLSKGRSVITEEYIRKWFADLSQFLEENNVIDILSDPSRIFNGDETSFALCPKTGKVLAPKGWKDIYEVKMAAEKETITVLLVFSADGKIVYPMLVFPYKRPPKALVDSLPPNWFLGRSETGWMRGDVFFEYIANGFNKWLDEHNIKRPVLLFIDGHKSHLTMEVSEFCSQNQIILYSLPPNTTHMMQPADVSVFRPLKANWKKTVRNWQGKPQNQNCVITKTSFAPLLKETLDQTELAKAIINGFKKCGLYPFDSNNVDYTKCIKNYVENLNTKKNVENHPTLSKHEIEAAEKVLRVLKADLQDDGIQVERVLQQVKQLKKSDKIVEDLTTFEVLQDGMLQVVTEDPSDNNEIDLKYNETDLYKYNETNYDIWTLPIVSVFSENNEDIENIDDRTDLEVQIIEQKNIDDDVERRKILDTKEIDQNVEKEMEVDNGKKNMESQETKVIFQEHVEKEINLDNEETNTEIKESIGMVQEHVERKIDLNNDENNIESKETKEIVKEPIEKEFNVDDDRSNSEGKQLKEINEKEKYMDLDTIEFVKEHIKAEFNLDNDRYNIESKEIIKEHLGKEMDLDDDEKNTKIKEYTESVVDVGKENFQMDGIEKLVAVPASKQIRVLQNVLLDNLISPISPASGSYQEETKPESNETSGILAHLFWPKPIEKTQKRIREKQPAAISSEAFRSFLKHKVDKKLEEQKQKEEKKEARKRKADEKRNRKKDIKKKPRKAISKESNKSHGNCKEMCQECGEELISEAEEDEEKNIGCDNCSKWFHLKCTEFIGMAYNDVLNEQFKCSTCS